MCQPILTISDKADLREECNNADYIEFAEINLARLQNS